MLTAAALCAITVAALLLTASSAFACCVARLRCERCVDFDVEVSRIATSSPLPLMSPVFFNS
jgi:hypothetical protein